MHLAPHKSGLLADFCALGIDYRKKKDSSVMAYIIG